MQPSFSGWLVTCAYLPVCPKKKTRPGASVKNRSEKLPLPVFRAHLRHHVPHTTLPLCVTRPSSLTLTWEYAG